MICSFSLIEDFDAPSVLSMQMIAEKDAHHVEIMQQLASQRDEEHHHRLAAELEKCDAEHRAIMDQLVKEKLDADKNYRDEVLDLKEHIAQLETKLHVDKVRSNILPSLPACIATRWSKRFFSVSSDHAAAFSSSLLLSCCPGFRLRRNWTYDVMVTASPSSVSGRATKRCRWQCRRHSASSRQEPSRPWIRVRARRALSLKTGPTSRK